MTEDPAPYRLSFVVTPEGAAPESPKDYRFSHADACLTTAASVRDAAPPTWDGDFIEATGPAGEVLVRYEPMFWVSGRPGYWSAA